MANMAEAASFGPPSRFGLTLVYDPEEAVSAERMLGALGLMNISRDPDSMMWPIRLRKANDIDPSLDEIYGLKMDWQEVFVEDSFYQFFVAEPFFDQVYRHCGHAFPDHTIVFQSLGRTAKVDIAVVPMEVPPILQTLWAQRTEITELRRSNHRLTRQLELLEHNMAVIARELVAGAVIPADDLHPDTPESWTVKVEEY